jgi:glycosyltransferase involved in cell wall biosynthesis
MIAYDITRLLTRVLNATPNGIDRLDLAYAKHFLTAAHSTFGLVHMGLAGHRAFGSTPTLQAIENIIKHLREADDPTNSTQLDAIINWLAGKGQKPVFQVRPKSILHYGKVARFHVRHLGLAGAAAVNTLPFDSRYLCVSQYPLSVNGAYQWLEQRSDIKPVFFIHDLLPFTFPEFFKEPERDRHERRMGNLSRHGAAALVTTQVVKSELQTELQRRGRGNMPIHISTVPLAQSFLKQPKSQHKAQSYFIMCGTIEPRKNHLMILQVWRALSAKLGSATPKLVLVGARGWENENVVDLLERSPAIRKHVLEVNGISTPDVASLMAGARALLMPSFGEGYGLPVAEALALGIPVIASDIPVFHEIASSRVTHISPLNGEGWMSAIEHCLTTVVKKPSVTIEAKKHETSFTDLEEFLASL